MVDTISRKRRSENMRRIRSKGMNPERKVERVVRRFGYRLQYHRTDLPGRPDIVIPSLRKVIDVRGCFWHQHAGCIDRHTPKSRVAYWRPKLRGNVLRDRRNLAALRKGGWKVLVLWECQIAAMTPKKLLDNIGKFLRG